VAGALEALRSLAARPERIAVGVISGRTVNDLRSLLSPPGGIALAGVHGLQLLDFKGEYEVGPWLRECEDDFAQVRAWLNHNLPRRAGFVVEDKGIAVALHYRQAARRIANYVRDSFEQFLVECTSSLAPSHGKMVLEAIPKTATKASAVLKLRQRVASSFEPVYFGDDVTDEDAFAELAEHGIAVLVGQSRRSAARYRVDAPADVVHVLEQLVATLAES